DDEDVRASTLDRLRSHPVLDEARSMARAWAADAVAELDPLPESAAKQALTAFADLLVDRLARRCHPTSAPGKGLNPVLPLSICSLLCRRWGALSSQPPP